MSRTNEYKVKGGAFADPDEAINALDSLLEDVKETDAKSAYNTETERQYHTNILGLQDCLDKVLADAKPAWKDLGLDGSFALVREDASREAYKRKAVFQHPVYEHVWLTNSDGKDLAEELMPFLYLNLEYQKNENAVNLSYAKVETKLNLPELKTSLKAAREDLQLVKTEVERAGSVLSTALETVTRATKAIREFCDANHLNFEISEGAADLIAEVTSSEKKKGSSVAASATSEPAIEATGIDTQYESEEWDDESDAADLVIEVEDEVDEEDEDENDLALDDMDDVEEEEDDDLISALEDSLDEDDLDENANYDASVRNSTPPPLARNKG